MPLQLLLAAAGVGGTLAIHFTALFWLLRRHVMAARLRSVTLLAFCLLFAHLIEIGLFGLLYLIALRVGLGELQGPFAATAGDYFYFSAVTFTSLGFGDITPSAGLRIMTAVEALNGLVLIGITTSAVVVALTRVIHARVDDPDGGQAPHLRAT